MPETIIVGVDTRRGVLLDAALREVP